MKLVKSHKDAGPFLQPVDDSYAPSYHHIIKEPMDISTMEEKIHQRLYKNQMEMENDFKKMVNNCEVYNGVGNVYTNMAFSLWRVFLKSVRKYFGETVSWPRLRPSGCMYIANSTNENHHIKIVIRSSPPFDVVERRHKKRKAKKKRKRPPGMKAIEALALAAEEALKNSNFEDDSSTNDQVSSEFPGLKISTTQSHPASMLVKYSSSSGGGQESDSAEDCARDSWKERPSPNSKRKCATVRDLTTRGSSCWRNSKNRTQVNGKQGRTKPYVPTAAARKMYEDSMPNDGSKKQMDFSVFDFVDETPPSSRPATTNAKKKATSTPKKPSAKVSPMPFNGATRRRLSSSSSGKDNKSLEWNLLKPLTLQIPTSQPKSIAYTFPTQEELTNSMSHLLDVSPSLYANPYFAHQPIISQGGKFGSYNTGLHHQHTVKL